MNIAIQIAKSTDTAIFRMDKNKEMDREILESFIEKHQSRKMRYNYLKNLYESKHDILFAQEKPPGKPDNRLVTNYAKYITDTFEGYFAGIPIKTSHSDDRVTEYLNELDKLNNQNDNNSELSKLCSIYGHAFELLYQDEEARVGMTYIPPADAFIIYDNSIREKALYGVRYYVNNEGEIHGSYSDKQNVYFFDKDFNITETQSHSFGAVPLIEYVQNEERQGIYESVVTLIEDYNKSTSEKSNDVDYFADAYMKLIGAEMDESDLPAMRENRFINIFGDTAENVDLDFLEKPNADSTQENHINRLKEDIFTISMVANISDENFGNASGVSLAYKLHAMSNLAATKERKFTASMNERYKLICNYPNAGMTGDDWAGIKYSFKRNTPKNISEETENAQNLRGIVSHETILNNLSIVESARDEKELIEQEKQENSMSLEDYQSIFNEVKGE